MTGFENTTADELDALAIRAMAQDWVVERRAGAIWSDEDQARLDSWLAQSPAHLVAYWRMDAAWDCAQRLAAVNEPMPRDRGIRPFFRLHRAKIVAAAALVAALGAGVLTQFREPADRVYTTPLGGQMTVKLADGSEIQLNTNSMLRLSSSRRQATLERGEAYFAIKHDASNPFVLTVAGYRVIDLGTKFSVHTEGESLEVALVEGMAKVEPLHSATEATAAVLHPGDVAIATSTSLSLKAKPIARIQDELSWRQGVLTFKNVTLADAATTFNRYNNTKIIIADSSVGKLTLYGTFPMKDVSAFADAAQAYFNLHVSNRNSEIVISR